MDNDGGSENHRVPHPFFPLAPMSNRHKRRRICSAPVGAIEVDLDTEDDQPLFVPKRGRGRPRATPSTLEFEVQRAPSASIQVGGHKLHPAYPSGFNILNHHSMPSERVGHLSNDHAVSNSATTGDPELGEEPGCSSKNVRIISNITLHIWANALSCVDSE